jgi:hypothetical protein
MLKLYWFGNGKYQQESIELADKLISNDGQCLTLEGELLRAAGVIYYSFHQHRNLNNTSGANLFIQKFLPNQSEQTKQDLAKHYAECNLGKQTTVNLVGSVERISDVVIEHILQAELYTPNLDDFINYQEDAPYKYFKSLNACAFSSML